MPFISGWKMLLPENTAHQTSLFGTDLLQQLDIDDPLLQLADVIPWSEFEQAFAKYYTSDVGRPAKPFRFMVGLQLLKYLENLGERGPRKNQKVNQKTRILGPAVSLSVNAYTFTWLRTSFSQYSVVSNEYNAVDLSPLQRERVGWGEIKNSSTLKKQKNLIQNLPTQPSPAREG